jgi:hypothetical protein
MQHIPRISDRGTDRRRADLSPPESSGARATGNAERALAKNHDEDRKVSGLDALFDELSYRDGNTPTSLMNVAASQ